MSIPVVAVDFGGTKIAAALVNADGDILAERQRPTMAFRGVDTRDAQAEPSDAETVAGQLDGVIDDLLTGYTGPLSRRIGIGSAGPIDITDGTSSPVNVPAWRRYPVLERARAALQRHLGEEPERAELAGDGPCIALGEQWMGAASDVKDAIGVVCSTGVGAGVVVGGKVFPGETGNATLFGHTSINPFGGLRCSCGTIGCVEAYASGPSLVRRATELGWSGEDAKALTVAAREGDRAALQAIDEGMLALGAGLAGLAAEYDIATVVVGGGVASAGEIVWEPLRRHFDAFITLPHLVGRARVVHAQLANAGLLGAAKLVLD